MIFNWLKRLIGKKEMSGRTERAPATVTHKIQTGGEITVNLVLTIKLDSDGLSITQADASALESKKMMKQQTHSSVDKEEEVDLIVPNIEIGNMIQFGEDVLEEGD